MKRNYPQKPLFFYAIFVFIAFLLTTCVLEPVDINIFPEGKVELYPGSEPGLTAGNGRITGLDPNKYYMIEEFNESGVSAGVQYVRSTGTRTSTFDQIGRVTGGAITGLTNKNQYKVTAATAIAAGTTLRYEEAASMPAPPPALTDTIPVTVAGITLDAPTAPNNLYLDVSPITTGTNTWQAVRFVLPSNTAQNEPISANIIALQGQNTVTDYVFAEITGGVPVGLKVLKVEVKAALELTINISLNILNDHTANFSPASITVSQNDLITGSISGLNITITNSTGMSDIFWYYNGTQLNAVSSASLNLPFSSYDGSGYFAMGNQVFTVFFTVGGINYCTNCTVSVGL